VLISTTLLVWGAGVAAAHVTVNPGSVTAGSYAKLTFRVPTESDTASTVSLQVTLPEDHPFPSVSVMQIPGWTAKVTKTPLDPPVTEGRFDLTEAVTSITWTADDGVGVKPGEFMEFPISVGPVPDVPSMEFPADQTYSDGSVVRWNQSRTADGDEPEHPAPLLTIAAASGSAGPTVTGTDGTDQSTAVATAPDNTARVLGVVALVLAALALLVAAFGIRRRPRTPAPAAPSGPPSPPGAGDPPSGDPS
jgi:uncharacterized protein YcnI